MWNKRNESSRENTKNLGFRPGLTQTSLFSNRSRLEAWNFRFNKKRDCTIRVAKTKEQKALISFAVTEKLVCALVFASFSDAAAQIKTTTTKLHFILLSEFQLLPSSFQISC